MVGGVVPVGPQLPDAIRYLNRMLFGLRPKSPKEPRAPWSVTHDMRLIHGGIFGSRARS